MIGDEWHLSQRIGSGLATILGSASPGDGVFVIGVNFGDHAEVWKSNDWGETFSYVQTLAGVTEIRCIALCAGVLMAGTWPDGGVWYGGPSGSAWTRMGGLPGAAYCQCLLQQGGALLAGSGTNGSIFTSSDGGVTWSLLNHVTTYYVYDMLFTSSGSLIAICSTGIFRSVNGGATFTRVSTQYCGNVLELSTGTLLAGHNGAFVVRSVNDGLTWVRSSAIASITRVDSITETQDGIILLCGSSNGWICRSTNDGLTFAPVVKLGSQDDPPTSNLTSYCIFHMGGERCLAPSSAFGRIFKSGPIPVVIPRFHPEWKFRFGPL